MPQRSVVVAAAQMPFAWAVSPQEYFDRMHAPIAQIFPLFAVPHAVSSLQTPVLSSAALFGSRSPASTFPFLLVSSSPSFTLP